MALYPPILDGQLAAIPYSSQPNTQSFSLFFNMPTVNAGTNIGHVQLAIKLKATNQPAVNTNISPDGIVIFFLPNLLTQVDPSSTLYKLTLPYSVFAGGAPKIDTTYTIQIRFGESTLWNNSGTNANNNQFFPNNFLDYARWRREQVNKMPSKFGEWSNVSSMYCHAAHTATLSYDQHWTNFSPTLLFTDSCPYSDPITQVKIIYNYQTSDGYQISQFVGTGSYIDGSSSYEMEYIIPIAPISTVRASVEAVTKNNTILTATCTIPSITSDGSVTSLSLYFQDVALQDDEKDDGVIVKEIYVPINSQTDPLVNWDFYRFKMSTLETVKLGQGVRIVRGVGYQIKDYSVEMGEHYQYVAMGYDGSGTRVLYSDLSLSREAKSYGRLMMLQYPVLTDKFHQLRLSGNLSINDFKINVQEGFQTTLGAEYPFYSKNAKTHYRSLSLSAVVSAQFDPTFAFWHQDHPTIRGEFATFDALDNYIVSQSLEGIVPREGDTYRVQTSANSSPSGWYVWESGQFKYLSMGGEIQYDSSGQEVTYYNYSALVAAHPTATNGQMWLVLKDDSSIYPSKKAGYYRWETPSNSMPGYYWYDPKLKISSGYANTGLWWVADESNRKLLIFNKDIYKELQFSVNRQRMLEGNTANISGLDHRLPSNRIAGSNNQNEIMTAKRGPKGIYDQKLMKVTTLDFGTEQTGEHIFVERKFRELVMEWLTNGKPKLYRSETEGNMIVVCSGVSFSPVENSHRMIYTASMTLTEIAPYSLQSLLDYDLLPIQIETYVRPDIGFEFNPGNADPGLDDDLIYQYSPDYDIPFGADGTTILPIHTYPAVKNGIPPFQFYESAAAPMPNNIDIHPLSGVIYGTFDAINGSRPGKAVIGVRDSRGQAAEMTINVNSIFSTLKFDKDPAWKILSLILGQSIAPINVSPGVSGGALPYKYRIENFPIGLVIDKDTGIISGAPVYETIKGEGIVTVIDSLGHTASITIDYGRMWARVTITPEDHFNVPWLALADSSTSIASNYPLTSFEPTNTYTLSNLATWVYGGEPYLPPFPYAYSGTQAAVIKNSTVAEEYLFSFTFPPDQRIILDTADGVNYTFKANSLGDPSTFEARAWDSFDENSNPIVATVGKIFESLRIAPFSFPYTDSSGSGTSTAIDYPINNPNGSANNKTIPITASLSWDLSQFCHGGIPPYTYSIPQLSANFSLDKQKGILYTQLRASQSPIDLDFILTDARGVTVSRKLHFAAVGNDLAFYKQNGWCGNTLRFPEADSKLLGMDIPPLYLGMNGGVTMMMYQFGDNKLNHFGKQIDLRDCVKGGLGTYTYSKVSGPDWLTVSSDGYVRVTLPTNAQDYPDGTTFQVLVTDQSPGIALKSVLVCNIEAVVKPITFTDRAEFDIPPTYIGTEMVSNVSSSNKNLNPTRNNVNLEDGVKYGYKGFSGYYQYYADPNLIAPFNISSVDGLISGGHQNELPFPARNNIPVTVRDDFANVYSQQATININKNAVIQGLSFGNTAPTLPPLIVNWSKIPLNTIKVLTAQGGSGSYSYTLSDSSRLASGLVYDINGYFEGDNNTSLMPTETKPAFDLVPYIQILDSITGNLFPAPSGQTWGVPQVYPRLEYGPGVVSGVYTVGPEVFELTYQSDILVLNNGYPYVKAVFDQLPEGMYLRYHTPNNDLETTNNVIQLNGRLDTSTIFTMDCKLTVTRPAAYWSGTTLIHNEEKIELIVRFSSMGAKLTFKPSDALPLYISGTAITNINLKDFVSGYSDASALEFEVFQDTQGLFTGHGITLSTNGIISGTPSSPCPAGYVRIRVREGQGPWIDLPPISGSYPAIIPNVIPYAGIAGGLDFPAIPAIPAMAVNTNLTEIDLASTVSGGVPPYNFNSALLPLGSGSPLSPYVLTTDGKISGNSGPDSLPARTFNITVMDSTGLQATQTLAVGQIYGGDFQYNGSPKISSGVVNTAISPCDLSFSLPALTSPDGYTFAMVDPLPANLTLNASTGVITGSITSPHIEKDYKFTVTRTENGVTKTSNGTLIIEQFNAGLQFTDDPSFDIPEMPTNSYGGQIMFMTGISGGNYPVRFTVSGGSISPYTMTEGGILTIQSLGTTQVAKTATIQADDGATQKTITINIGKIYQGPTLTLTNSMESLTLVAHEDPADVGYSTITARTIAAGSGGTGSGYTYRVVDGTGAFVAGNEIFPGITLNQTTGAISGTPLQRLSSPQNIKNTIRVYDSDNHWATSATDWFLPTIVKSMRQVSDAQVGFGYVNRAFTSQDWLTDGLPSCTESFSGASMGSGLFSGLSFNTTTGVISGTPTAVTSTNTVLSTPANLTIAITRTQPSAAYTPSASVSLYVTWSGWVAPLTLGSGTPSGITSGVTSSGSRMIAGNVYYKDFNSYMQGGVRPLKLTVFKTGTTNVSVVVSTQQYQLTISPPAVTPTASQWGEYLSGGNFYNVHVTDGVISTPLSISNWSIPATVYPVRQLTTEIVIQAPAGTSTSYGSFIANRGVDFCGGDSPSATYAVYSTNISFPPMPGVGYDYSDHSITIDSTLLTYRCRTVAI